MNTQQRIGILLILVGALFLLHETHLIVFSGRYTMAVLLVAIGGLLLQKAWKHPQKKGILGGSFFLFFGLALFFVDVSCRGAFIGVLLIALGIANLINYFFSGHFKTSNLVFALLFSAVGGTMLAAVYNVFDVYEFRDVVETYWPIVLIIMGLGLVADSYRGRRESRNENEAEPPADTLQD